MPKILLVNDEQAIREILLFFLGRLGHQTDQAEDDDQALALYKERGPYDIVLTDVMHPGIGGIALLERIKEQNPDQIVAIVGGFIPDGVDLPFLKLPAEFEEVASFVKNLVRP